MPTRPFLFLFASDSSAASAYFNDILIYLCAGFAKGNPKILK